MKFPAAGKLLLVRPVRAASYLMLIRAALSTDPQPGASGHQDDYNGECGTDDDRAQRSADSRRAGQHPRRRHDRTV